ncbi:MAG: dihydrolipoamide acetyltransferase family protein [Bacteroidetes bacterium]|nr:dihydrolipoamide acetyltransferase family protein [Bacteroidota bacterium]
MAEFQLVMPKMGESIAEATIIKWMKNEGDSIAMDETLLEIATDKVDSEVPSSYAGILTKKLFKENDVVAVGAVIAIITDSKALDSAPPAVPNAVIENKVSEIVKEAAATLETKVEAIAQVIKPIVNGNRFYSPLVLNIARTENVTMSELEGMEGTGAEGRVTKRDIIAYLENRSNTAKPIGVSTSQEKPEIAVSKPMTAISAIPVAPKVVTAAGDEIIEMDRMRKLIAEHMVMSKHVSPHVTSFVECDVTNLVRWREKVKTPFEKKEGEKITFTPIFVECVVKAIKDFPMVNISIDGTNIIKRKNINIGMATALPTGNLIVPVIKNADHMNLVGLTKCVNDLANRARQNKLLPDDIQGGTFTITNVGTFGNVMGTPIIFQPQVAILAIGAIRKKPAVIETAEGDMIAIRSMMFLSLSYDHRVVDGVLGGSFLRKIGDYLEAWDVKREI